MRLVEKLKNEKQNFRLAIEAVFSCQKERIKNTVPYVSQFAHPEYAEKILKEGFEKTSDPKWQETGAKSPEEYAEWVLTICGMACTSMVLQHFKKRKIGIISLAKEAKSYGVYKEQKGELSNMYYKEYADWISLYGLQAKIYTRLGISGLQKLLSDGYVVIVSVNPNIRDYKNSVNEKPGGHLVLMTGYDKDKNTLTLHNPSGFTKNNTQKNHTIPIMIFINYYAGRGIALK